MTHKYIRLRMTNLHFLEMFFASSLSLQTVMPLLPVFRIGTFEYSLITPCLSVLSTVYSSKIKLIVQKMKSEVQKSLNKYVQSNGTKIF